MAEILDLFLGLTSCRALDLCFRSNSSLVLDSSEALARLGIGGDWCAADLSQPSRLRRFRLDPGVSGFFEVDRLDGFVDEDVKTDVDKTVREVDKSRAAAVASPFD